MSESGNIIEKKFIGIVDDWSKLSIDNLSETKKEFNETIKKDFDRAFGELQEMCKDLTVKIDKQMLEYYIDCIYWKLLVTDDYDYCVIDLEKNNLDVDDNIIDKITIFIATMNNNNYFKKYIDKIDRFPQIHNSTYQARREEYKKKIVNYINTSDSNIGIKLVDNLKKIGWFVISVQGSKNKQLLVINPNMKKDVNIVVKNNDCIDINKGELIMRKKEFLSYGIEMDYNIGRNLSILQFSKNMVCDIVISIKKSSEKISLSVIDTNDLIINLDFSPGNLTKMSHEMKIDMMIKYGLRNVIHKSSSKKKIDTDPILKKKKDAILKEDLQKLDTEKKKLIEKIDQKLFDSWKKTIVKKILEEENDMFIVTFGGDNVYDDLKEYFNGPLTKLVYEKYDNSLNSQLSIKDKNDMGFEQLHKHLQYTGSHVLTRLVESLKNNGWLVIVPCYKCLWRNIVLLKQKIANEITVNMEIRDNFDNEKSMNEFIMRKKEFATYGIDLTFKKTLFSGFEITIKPIN